MIKYNPDTNSYEDVQVTQLSDEQVLAEIDAARGRIDLLNAQIAEQQAIIDNLSISVSEKAEAVALKAQSISAQKTEGANP